MRKRLTKIQAVRGMNDILPSDSPFWHKIESVFQRLAESYGYQEIRTPIVESTTLFTHAIGELTDIVEKEMYTFSDKNGEKLSLRPEGTASCVRAGIQHGLFYNQIQRLWYVGPMFRHERPQKGRYRQFHQFGIEAYGFSGADIDAEIILLSRRLWRELNLEEHVHLQLNSLGTLAERNQYREKLVEYFKDNISLLDEDSHRRLENNPLRILDSKNQAMQELIQKAPSFLDYLGSESLSHFQQLQSLLSDNGVKFTINPRLVRGLDYYGSTVFEWVCDHLGAQSTVCAGGRYDQLVETHGGKPTPAIGFAGGIERLILILESLGQSYQQTVHAYLVLNSDKATQAGIKIAETLRQAVPGLNLVTNCGGGSYKSQFKKADKSGATIALILGDTEIGQDKISIKPLREDTSQQLITIENLIEQLTSIVNEEKR